MTQIHVVIDDTDRPRCKGVKILYGFFKTLDKLTNGWIQAQNIVFLCLVTDRVTVVFFFTFYRPDPIYSAWEEKDKKLRKLGHKKKDRPKGPKRRSNYPTRIEIAINLLARLKSFLSQFEELTGKQLKVKSILFDCAYMSPKIQKMARKNFKKVQLISQIASNQKVWNRSGCKKTAEEYFNNLNPQTSSFQIRDNPTDVIFVSARLTVQSHGRVFHVVAIKYRDEAKFRYLIAADLSWKAENIIRAYALRWLIEVVNFDWKQHDGWGESATQQGADGACRGMILSLLVDSFLLTHPLQIRQSRAGLQLWTAGSVVQRVQYDHLLDSIEELFASPDPEIALKQIAESVGKYIKLRPSTKHMKPEVLAALGPSLSLQLVWGSG